MDNRDDRRGCRHCDADQLGSINRRNCSCGETRDCHNRENNRFEDTLEDAYNEGYKDGFFDGYKEGYEKGYCVGYQEGCKDGYAKAKEEVLEYINRNRCCCKCCRCNCC